MIDFLAWLTSSILGYGIYTTGFLLGFLSWRELAGNRTPRWVVVCIWLLILPFLFLVYIQVMIALRG